MLQSEMTINERLKYAREQKNLLQKDLAEKVGISRPAYNQIEKGKHNLTARMVKDVCRVLRISSDWLITGKGEMNLSSVDALGIALDELAIDKDNDFGKMVISSIEAFGETTPEDKDAICDFIRRAVISYNEKNGL